MIEGVPEIDALSLGEVSVNFISEPIRMEGKAAFLNSKTKNTHGWTKNVAWSKETMKKLEALKNSMESDLADIHFTSTDSTSSTSAVDTIFQPAGGLGEHLGTLDDTKQV